MIVADVLARFAFGSIRILLRKVNCLMRDLRMAILSRRRTGVFGNLMHG